VYALKETRVANAAATAAAAKARWGRTRRVQSIHSLKLPWFQPLGLSSEEKPVSSLCFSNLTHA
jgi:hypothetical protein